MLKPCKKCTQIFLFSRFLKNAETFQRICWICAETLWEIRRKKRWIFFKTCTQNALKLCYFMFSKERWNFPMDDLNLCWNFVRHALKLYYFTFPQERWNFSTDELNLCPNFAKNALEIFWFHVFSKLLKLF